MRTTGERAGSGKGTAALRFAGAPCGITHTPSGSILCISRSRLRAAALWTTIRSASRASCSTTSRWPGVGRRGTVCSTTMTGTLRPATRSTTSSPSSPPKMPNSCWSTTTSTSLSRAERGLPRGARPGDELGRHLGRVLDHPGQADTADHGGATAGTGGHHRLRERGGERRDAALGRRIGADEADGKLLDGRPFHDPNSSPKGTLADSSRPGQAERPVDHSSRSAPGTVAMPGNGPGALIKPQIWVSGPGQVSESR